MVRVFLLVCLSAFVVFMPYSALMATTSSPPPPWQHYALLRLEDVGPGGPYGTLQGLGKLRAVLEELQKLHVTYHVAMISEYKAWPATGQGHYKQIAGEGPIGRPFLQVMKAAQEQGAIIGMHGYSHQYGDHPRPDGQQNTGFGREFNVPGSLASQSPDYARQQIEKSIAAFQRMGIRPHFWEAPHYAATEWQQEVFRSYFGLMYQPDMYSLRSLRDLEYHTNVNTYGQPSLGSVYVPAPLRYVHNQGSLKVILGQLIDYKGIASMYFHPFLEFPSLEPVIINGHPVIRDGIPEYRYRAGSNSLLHQLVDGIRQKGYQFVSIHEIVPFTPSQRWMIPSTAENVQTGDVTGDGRSDIVWYDTATRGVYVLPSNAGWVRNKPQATTQLWMRFPVSTSISPRWMLWRSGSSNQCDLVVYSNGEATVYKNTGSGFDPTPMRILLPITESDSLLVPSAEQDLLEVSASSRRLALYHQGQWLPLNWPAHVTAGPTSSSGQFFLGDVNADGNTDVVHIGASGQIDVSLGGLDSYTSWRPMGSVPTGIGTWELADSNGDGRSDLIVYDAQTGSTRVFLSTGSIYMESLRPLSPWATGGAGWLVGDFDGNGKTDVAVINASNKDHSKTSIDLALSEQRRQD